MKAQIYIAAIIALVLSSGCQSSIKGVITSEIPDVIGEIPDIQERPEYSSEPVPLFGDIDEGTSSDTLIDVGIDEAPEASEPEAAAPSTDSSSEDNVSEIESEEDASVTAVIHGRCNGKKPVVVRWYDRRNPGQQSRERVECLNGEYQLAIHGRRSELKHMDVVVDSY